VTDSIVIIDYGCGNPASISSMLKKVGYRSIVSSDISTIENADKLILPGVGSFDHAIKNLMNLDLIPTLNQKVISDKTPILGICLGAQLLCNQSEEGETKGLGWVDADVVVFDKERLNDFDKVPSMGWCELEVKSEGGVLSGFEDTPRFYFAHSYHLLCRSESDISATAIHGYEFTAAVEKENIVGVQFHPEKSHRFGMKLLYNFANTVRL